ncbi:MAG TPA: pyridoxal-phosphate dependent enzyme [Longimicrobium sp.]|nr:pyridoxal-phosphate dependent enzyme [Longimicrobium sp.]
MLEAAFIQNSSRRTYSHRPPREAAYQWHTRQPYFAPTPLVNLDELAPRLGHERIWVKDERNRCGTTSFKILGASWALHAALQGRGADGRGSQVRTLFAGTDGNHGCAVARLARLHGLRAEIFVPAGTAPERIAAIERERTVVRVVDGAYDDAVQWAACAADAAGAAGLLVSDTALHPDDPTPQWTIEGTGTIFREVHQELCRQALPLPDLVLVPIGVGGLAAAAIRHFRACPAARDAVTRVVGVEPATAACAALSIAAGHISTVKTPFDSTMAGLNAQTPSFTAWEDLLYGLDGVVTMSDAWCADAFETLTAAGLRPGPTGLAALAGLFALHAVRGEDPALRWLDDARHVVLVVTEGE